MLPCPLQATLVNHLHHSAVLFYLFFSDQSIHIVDKACPRGWNGQGIADLDEVGILNKEENG
jgi:hypothetical protein